MGRSNESALGSGYRGFSYSDILLMKHDNHKSPSTLITSQQESEFLKPGAASYIDVARKDVLSMPPPRKLVQPAANGVPPPPFRSMVTSLARSTTLCPPKNMPPPPSATLLPPPSLPLVSTMSRSEPNSLTKFAPKQKPSAEAIPDPLLMLMEYGDDDDDVPGGTSDQGLSRGVAVGGAAAKPFWAV